MNTVDAFELINAHREGAKVTMSLTFSLVPRRMVVRWVWRGGRERRRSGIDGPMHRRTD